MFLFFLGIRFSVVNLNYNDEIIIEQTSKENKVKRFGMNKSAFKRRVIRMVKVITAGKIPSYAITEDTI